MSDLERSRQGWHALNRGDLDLVLFFIDLDVEWRPALGPGGMEGNGYLHSRGRSSGAEVRVPFGQLAQFRDELVVRLYGYPDRASAREAAGLRE